MSAAIAAGSGCLLAIGAAFCLATAIGLLRFPDVDTRLHAGTKALTGGALLILLGGMPLAGSWSGALRLAVIALFYLLTNALAIHAIARAIHLDRQRTTGHRPPPPAPDRPGAPAITTGDSPAASR